MARAALLALLAAPPSVAQSLPEPLTDQPGNPERGRAIVVSRQSGLCLLCHSGPFADVPQQGNLAPDLTGVGARLSAGDLRARLVNARAVTPDSLMPPYHEVAGQVRVAAAFAGKPLLDAQAIEDVVAFLEQLK